MTTGPAKTPHTSRLSVRSVWGEKVSSLLVDTPAEAKALSAVIVEYWHPSAVVIEPANGAAAQPVTSADAADVALNSDGAPGFSALRLRWPALFTAALGGS